MADISEPNITVRLLRGASSLYRELCEGTDIPIASWFEDLEDRCREQCRSMAIPNASLDESIDDMLQEHKKELNMRYELKEVHETTKALVESWMNVIQESLSGAGGFRSGDQVALASAPQVRTYSYVPLEDLFG